MIRDSRCDEKYFENCISKYLEEAKFAEKAFLKGDGKPEKLPIIAAWSFSSYLKLAIACYSAGYPIEKVREKLVDVVIRIDLLVRYISDIKEGKLPLEWYNEIIWTISLSVLFDLDESNFRKIASSIDRMNRPDRLVDLLLSYKLKDRPISTDSYYSGFSIEIADRYRPLFIIFEEQDTLVKTSILVEYLKLWYRRQQLCAWYGNHKKHNYFGYWSFESAAIAKITGLENTKITKNKYFPCGFN